MKYLREASDIHLDWDIDRFHETRMYDPNEPKITCAMDLLWFPPGMEDDLETTFIVAGDIWVDGRFAKRCWPGSYDTWLIRMARRFKYVVLVLGNHDYWERNVLYEPAAIKKIITEQGLTNVHLLERDAVVLDQVKFIGGTLWTDYNRGDPMVMHGAPGYMNDYKYIKYGSTYKRVHPRDLYEIFRNTKRFIFQNAKRDHPDQKVVVVTHMAPSEQSVSDHHRQSYFLHANFLYYSNIEEQIKTEGKDIDYWFHGHMHHSDQYYLGNTKVVLNPRGYINENSLFDDQLRIPI